MKRCEVRDTDPMKPEIVAARAEAFTDSSRATTGPSDFGRRLQFLLASTLSSSSLSIRKPFPETLLNSKEPGLVGASAKTGSRDLFPACGSPASREALIPFN